MDFCSVCMSPSYFFKNMKSKLFLSLLVCAICSCTNSNSLCVFETTNVEDYPETSKLSADSTFTLDSIFVKNFRIVDSLVILDTNDSECGWKMSTLPSMVPSSGLFRTGHALGEFVFTPSLRRSQFFYQDDKLNVAVYDFGNGKVYKSRIPKQQGDSIVELKDIKAEKNLDNFIYISDDEYIYRKNTHQPEVKQLVYIKNGKKINLKSFDILNHIEVAEDDYNSLAAYMHYNVEKQKLVQAYKYYNIVNIVDISNDNGKTLCLGSKPVPESDIVSNMMRNSYLEDMRVYKEYFVVLAQIEDKSSLLFFDYNGNPLKKLVLDSTAKSFDIDFNRNKILTFNNETLVFKMYSL